MTNYWLYDQVKVEKPDWEPTFAMQSTINWINALSFEILGEHGKTSKEQADSCKNIFASVNNRSGNMSLAPIFGPLFHSLSFSITLDVMGRNSSIGSWAFFKCNNFMVLCNL